MLAQETRKMGRAARIGLPQQSDGLPVDDAERPVFDRSVSGTNPMRFDEALCLRAPDGGLARIRWAPRRQIRRSHGVDQRLSGNDHARHGVGQFRMLRFQDQRLAGEMYHAERLRRGGRGADHRCGEGCESGERKGGESGHGTGYRRANLQSSQRLSLTGLSFPFTRSALFRLLRTRQAALLPAKNG